MLEPRHAAAREACGLDSAGALAGGDLKTASFPLPPVADVSLHTKRLFLCDLVIQFLVITHVSSIIAARLLRKRGCGICQA